MNYNRFSKNTNSRYGKPKPKILETLAHAYKECCNRCVDECDKNEEKEEHKCCDNEEEKKQK